jgi:hypothetical protein
MSHLAFGLFPDCECKVTPFFRTMQIFEQLFFKKISPSPPTTCVSTEYIYMTRARRRRAVCQVGDLFGLNTGRGPAAARVGVRSGCGSASRSVLGVTCRYCESPT